MKSFNLSFTVCLFAISGFIYSGCGDGEKSKTTEETSSERPSGEHTSEHGHTGSNAMMAAMEPSMNAMSSMTMTGDFDHDFAQMMINHHQGAIDMAQVELSSGKDESLRKMAETIMSAQREEIKQLQDFVDGHTPQSTSASGEHSDHNELHDAMKTMMDAMNNMQMTGDTDKDFAMMMIPHHQSARDMAKNQLSHGKQLELKQMAQKMIADQTREINELQTWLNTHQE